MNVQKKFVFDQLRASGKNNIDHLFVRHLVVVTHTVSEAIIEAHMKRQKTQQNRNKNWTIKSKHFISLIMCQIIFKQIFEVLTIYGFNPCVKSVSKTNDMSKKFISEYTLLNNRKPGSLLKMVQIRHVIEIFLQLYKHHMVSLALQDFIFTEKVFHGMKIILI